MRRTVKSSHAPVHRQPPLALEPLSRERSRSVGLTESLTQNSPAAQAGQGSGVSCSGLSCLLGSLVTLGSESVS